MEFKEQLEKEFIPKLEEFIKKEEEHLEFLKKSKEKTSKWQNFCAKYKCGFSPSIHFQNNMFEISIGNSIASSEKHLAGFRLRLEEYKKYLQKIS